MSMIELLTPQEVANELKVTRRTVYSYIKEEKLKARKIGGLWKVTQKDLRDFLFKG